jgi:hypothetical protein
MVTRFCDVTETPSRGRLFVPLHERPSAARASAFRGISRPSPCRVSFLLTVTTSVFARTALNAKDVQASNLLGAGNYADLADVSDFDINVRTCGSHHAPARHTRDARFGRIDAGWFLFLGEKSDSLFF